jgi:endonuclease/exonuclease/phosphatase family metal-dependent hydrolase
MKAGCIDWNAHLPRICTWALFESTYGSQPLLVFNTHIDHESAESQFKSLELLAAYILKFKSELPGVPILVTGDFNVGPESQAVQRFKEILGSEISPIFPGMKDNNNGTFHGFTGKPLFDYPIDYIWSVGYDVAHPKSVSVDRYSEDGRFPSDHFPVRADITINNRLMFNSQ